MKMKAPKGMSGCSVDGVEYAVNKRGLVDVPEAAAAELASHGFRGLSDVDPDAASDPTAETTSRIFDSGEMA